VSLSDKERALLLAALARHAVQVRYCIDVCERDMPGMPPPAPGALASYREDLTLIDRLYARIQTGDLS